MRCIALLLLLLSLAACSEEPASGPPEHLWFIGVEALGWDRCEALMAKGEMPNLAALIDEGTRATVLATDPLTPASTWASILSGKPPARHKIVSPLIALPTGRVSPAPSSQRPVQSFWQMLGDDHQTVGAIGFPQSWPAERVDGWMISDMVTPDRWSRAAEANFEQIPGHLETFPSRLYTEIEGFIRPREGLERELVGRFFDLREEEYELLYRQPIGPSNANLNPLGIFALEMQASRSRMDMLDYLVRTYEPKVNAIQLSLLDALQPYYWYFTYPEIFDAPADGTRRFGRAVDEGYRWIDEQIGRILAMAGPRDGIVLIGNRGWGAEEAEDPESNYGRTLRPAPTRKGVLVLAGFGVTPGKRLGEVSALDIIPTLLRWTGRDGARDQTGSAIGGAFQEGYLQGIPSGVIDTHEENWNSFDRFERVETP